MAVSVLQSARHISCVLGLANGLPRPCSGNRPQVRQGRCGNGQLLIYPAGFADPTKPALTPYTADEASSHKFATLCVLECRGCEFVEFDPKVRSVSVCPIVN